MSSLLLGQISKMVVYILIGFALSRVHLIDEEQSKGLSVLCLYVSTPCAILTGFQMECTRERLRSLLIAFALTILIHVFLLLVYRLLEKRLHFSPAEGISMIYPNCGNLVIPLVMALLGNEYIIYCCAYISVQVTFIWTHGYSVITHEKRIDLRKAMVNPSIIAFALGLLLFFFGWKMPVFLTDMCDLFGSFTAPLAMLVAGVLLGKTSMAELRKFKRLPLMIITRLLLLPLVMLVIIKLIAAGTASILDPNIFIVFFLSCITPTASAIVQMVQIFSEDATYVSCINSLTMLLCALSMPLMMYLYDLI